MHVPPMLQFADQGSFGRTARGGFRLRQGERLGLGALAVAFSVCGILLVHPASLAHFAFYLCLWGAWILLFHRSEAEDFGFAFVVNSAFITVFYLVQTTVYPDSYGTTSPLGSWTDDSYFFALVADSLPANLVVRDNYFLYTHPFATLVRWVTPLAIEHPMDVIFFQSGIAAMLATFSRKFMFQMSSDTRLANTVYVFTLVCPFLMMNGGVIFIRDTFAAALFVYSLCCINSRRFVMALAALALQMAVRPGTALILVPAYVIIYFVDIRAFCRRHRLLVAVGVILVALAGLRIAQSLPDLRELVGGTSEGGGIGFLGREIITDLTAEQDGNVLFLSIQKLPFLVKLFLNGAYIFLYPFLSPKHAFAGEFFDLRGITMNLVVPIQAFWLNAWFIAGALSRPRVTRRQTEILIAVIVAFLLIGTYSLQTRHKTILYPLYYFIIAIGFVRASPKQRRFGYLCSSALLLLQLAALTR
jgi:hypothetical protein